MWMCRGGQCLPASILSLWQVQMDGLGVKEKAVVPDLRQKREELIKRVPPGSDPLSGDQDHPQGPGYEIPLLLGELQVRDGVDCHDLPPLDLLLHGVEIPVHQVPVLLEWEMGL